MLKDPSNAVIAAMIAEQAEPALCARLASTIICSQITKTCAGVPEPVMAGAFEDVATHAVGDVLRGR